jgi:hypothetical protein
MRLDMMAVIADIPCAYDDCDSHVEIVRVRFFHSSDTIGHTCVVFYQCLEGGHRWQKDLGPDALDTIAELFA